MISGYLSLLTPEVYFNKCLTQREFTAKQDVWVKERDFEMSALHDEIRLVFYKIGKTFGWNSKRVLGVRANYLVYYQDDDDTQTKGYCKLNNLYCAYFKTEDKYPYLLYLTNFSASALLYFPQLSELNKLRCYISKWVIQLDFNSQFQILDKVGEGSFSKVHLARKLQNNHEYAVKIVKKTDKNGNRSREAVEQQKTALSVVYSDYFSKLYEFYEDNDQFYFILQYIPGKNLMALIKQNMFMKLEAKKTLLKGILIALAYAHSKNIIHRDLKPQNIIVNTVSQRPKIIDLGLSLQVTKDTAIKQYKRCGTMGYIAPEVIANTAEHRKPYDCKADMFSFGIISHLLLFGTNPLKGKNYEQTFINNKNYNLNMDRATIVKRKGEKCLQMLEWLLAADPKNRPTAREALEHNFLNTSSAKNEYRTMSTTEKDVQLTLDSKIKTQYDDQSEEEQKNMRNYMSITSRFGSRHNSQIQP